MSYILYSKEHEYVEVISDSQIRIGLSQYALSELGEIVFVDLKEIGETLEIGDEIGSVESVKTVSGIYTPAAGTLISQNQDLISHPEMLNETSDLIWFVELKLDEALSLDELMNQEEYLTYTQSLS